MKKQSEEKKPDWRPAVGRWGQEAGAAMVAAFDASGLSMKAFARQHGLGTHRVSYWRAKVTGGEVGGARPVGFVRVRVAPASALACATSRGEHAVEVHLRNGRSLTIRGAWDEGSVRTWVRALEASS